MRKTVYGRMVQCCEINKNFYIVFVRLHSSSSSTKKGWGGRKILMKSQAENLNVPTTTTTAISNANEKRRNMNFVSQSVKFHFHIFVVLFYFFHITIKRQA
jgi:hypothetical protein